MIATEDRSHRGYHVAAHAAHRLILEQHIELRRLLALGLVETCMRSCSRPEPATLRVLVGRIHKAFVEHLADEEAALIPLLADEPPAGLRRAQILHEEHARQHRELDELKALSQAERGDGLADRFDRLARTLLTDVAEEERELARTVAALDQHAARDCGGGQRPIVQSMPHHGSRASSAASTATG